MVDRGYSPCGSSRSILGSSNIHILEFYYCTMYAGVYQIQNPSRPRYLSRRPSTLSTGSIEEGKEKSKECKKR
eukprot:14632395-Ditylum_brightwellii.AAC.1